MTWTSEAARAGAAGAAFAFMLAAQAAVPDDARESRWADEIVPQLVVGDAVWLTTPHRARVLALYAAPAGNDKGAMIVVHGAGVHPDWGLIGEIRSGLVDRGFATLSVQMPVLAADAPRGDYAALGPLAAERLEAALAWLRAKGHAHIGVVSHSMGASMVNGWMVSRPGIDAWVPIGMMAPFATAPRMPVLDVVAERDYPEALSRVPKGGVLPRDDCSAAITITDTDHFMTGAVPRLLDAIAPFLARALAERCATT